MYSEYGNLTCGDAPIKSISFPKYGGGTIKLKLRWSCPICGKHRGYTHRVIGQHETVHIWHNGCGHTETHESIRNEAYSNHLNDDLLKELRGAKGGDNIKFRKHYDSLMGG